MHKVFFFISSTLPNKDALNPALMKQALIAGAERLPQWNMFEQGHGKVDLVKSFEYLQTAQPIARYVCAAWGSLPPHPRSPGTLVLKIGIFRTQHNFIEINSVTTFCML